MSVVAILATAVLLGLVYQRISTARRRHRFAPPGVMVDVGGHRLHAICTGTGGPTVVLESGIAASSLSWARVQPEIAMFTRVCAYDRAGLAWSDPTRGQRTFAAIVEDLARVLASAAPDDRYVLVGHSFGSYVVRAYAARYPARVAGLVLIDPPAEWLDMTPSRARMLRRGRRLSRVGGVLAHAGIVRACLALLTGGAPGAPRRFVQVLGPSASHTLERLVGEVRKLPPDVHPVVQEMWCQPKCFGAMAEYLGVLEREGAAMVAGAPPCDIPVIVISAGNQSAEQLDAHRTLASSSTRGRHVVATRSTHWIQFDEPDLIVAAVRELVDNDRRAANDERVSRARGM